MPSFDLSKLASQADNEVFDFTREKAGYMVAYLHMALSALPEGHHIRKWVLQDINKELAKL